MFVKNDMASLCGAFGEDSKALHLLETLHDNLLSDHAACFAALQRAQELKQSSTASARNSSPSFNKKTELAMAWKRSGTPQVSQNDADADFRKGESLLAEGQKKANALYRQGKTNEARRLHLQHIDEGLECMSNYLERTDLRDEAKGNNRSWQFWAAAQAYAQQAKLSKYLDRPEGDIAGAHEHSVAACERLLQDYQGTVFPLGLAGELLLRESVSVMKSSDDYLKRAQKLKDQLPPNLEVISALLDVSNSLCEVSQPSEHYTLAAGLMDLAIDLEQTWYPMEYESHGGYNQALLEKGFALLQLGKIDEAQKLFDLQLALQPTYFPNMRNTLGREIQKARTKK